MGVAGMLVSAIGQSYSQNRDLERQSAAQHATARSMIQSMNYSFSNLEQERRSAFEATVDDLTKTRLQALRQQSSVDAAVNEGLASGGRTAALIKRSVANDTARTVESIKGNYKNKSNEIDLNKEASLLNTKTQIESMPKIKKPSVFSTLAGMGISYYNYKNVADEKAFRRNMAGAGSNNNSKWSYGGGIK